MFYARHEDLTNVFIHVVNPAVVLFVACVTLTVELFRCFVLLLPVVIFAVTEFAKCVPLSLYLIIKKGAKTGYRWI